MKPEELRIGNLVNYTTAEGDIEPIKITWGSLRWLTEDPEGFNLVHSPIHVTEEILLKCGFKGRKDFGGGPWFWGGKGIDLTQNIILSTGNRDYESVEVDGCESLKYLHQLQNLYHALTGKELEI